MLGLKHAWRQGGVASVLLFSLPIAGLTITFTILRSVDEEATPAASQPGVVALLKVAPPDSPGLSDWLFCSPVDLMVWKQQHDFLQGVTAFVANEEPWRLDGAYRMATVASADHGLFSTLGVQAALGRVWSNAEEEASTIVATDRFWRRSLGGERDVAGRTLWLDGQPYTLIGVLPGSFRLRAINNLGSAGLETRPLDLIRPIGRVHVDHTSSMFQVLAVPKDGVSLERLSSHLTGLEQQIVEEHPRSRPGTVVAKRYSDIVSSRFAKPIALTMWGMILLLLLAWANGGVLFLARAIGRTNEFAIRQALGGSRLKSLGVLMREQAWVTAAMAVAVILSAYGGVRLAGTLLPDQFPTTGWVRLNGGGIILVVVLSAATALVVSLAMHFACSGDPSTLKSQSAPSGGRTQKALSILVNLQFFLTALLVFAAGSLVLSFAQLSRQSVGFETAGRLAVGTRLTWRHGLSGREVLNLQRRLIDALSSLPGVQNVAAVSHYPFAHQAEGTVEIDGYNATDTNSSGPLARWSVVSADSFQVLGLRLLEGRLFRVDDESGDVPVAVINRTMREAYWKSRSAIGSRVLVNGQWRRIIGVVSDYRQSDLALTPKPEVFMAMGQASWQSMTMILKTRLRDPKTLVPTVEEAIARLSPVLVISNVDEMGSLVSGSISEPRFYAALSSIFAGLSLLLVAVGTYAAVSLRGRQLRHELGVRSAIGATRRSLIRSFFVHVLLRAGCGTALGLITSWALARQIEALVFKLDLAHPALYVVPGVAVLLFAATAACGPAFRYSRVDPAELLRST